MRELPVVVGIDVGGPKKGFHAVALNGRRYLDKYASLDAKAITKWCSEIGAKAIGIDAPCRWGTKGKAKLRFPLFFVFQPIGIMLPILVHAER